MEVYVLDSLFRRSVVVDRFESLIWTERWADIGDFELTLQSTRGNRQLFKTGARLALNESVRVMTVETVENTSDSEGQRLLKVTGRSLEAILDDRVAVGTYGGGSLLSEWSMTQTPEEVARAFFWQICVNGSLSASDIIPNIHWGGNLFPEDTMPESNFEILWYQKPDSLFKAIKELADIYDFGFRLYRNGDTGQLFFNVYTGNNRTLDQDVLTPVIFSQELLGLMNTTEFNTIEKTKNVALVIWERAGEDPGEDPIAEPGVDPIVYHAMVTAPELGPMPAEGFERRVLYIDGDIPDEDKDAPDRIIAQLERQGLDELAKHRAFSGFDGEISQYAQFKYGKDYYLGDLVVMQNVDGLRNNMRVTEQIFVSDREGDRAYPTLTFRTFASLGAWEEFGHRAWEDMAATEYWADQP